MIYLQDIKDEIPGIDEEGIYYYDMEMISQFIYGIPFINISKNFCKYTNTVRQEMEVLDCAEQFDKLKNYSTGASIRFKIVNADSFLVKAQLKRPWDYANITLYGSSGFDVYTFHNGRYIHKTVFAPKSGKRIFVHKISVQEGENICIYLPNYNEIEDLYLGCKGKLKMAEEYEKSNPVVFYGNSITQGASASRSGNSFVNIFGRKMNVETINYSLSNICRGLISIANLIATINCSAIVVDYTRNEVSAQLLYKRLEAFLLKLRKYHKEIPIVLMTSSYFNATNLIDYDDAVKNIYEKYSYDKNLLHLDVKNLFIENEYDIICVDGVHYNDYGMSKVSDALFQLLNGVI